MLVQMQDYDQMKRHPLSSELGDMGESAFRLLKRSVAVEYKQHHPIWLFEGMVLDGWHRFRAARDVGVPQIPAMEFVGTWDEARQFALSENDYRRHLPPKQHAARLALSGMKSKEIADMADVGHSLAKKFETLRERAPDVLEKINSGEITSTGHEVTKAFEAVQGATAKTQLDRKKYEYTLKGERIREFELFLKWSGKARSAFIRQSVQSEMARMQKENAELWKRYREGDYTAALMFQKSKAA